VPQIVQEHTIPDAAGPAEWGVWTGLTAICSDGAHDRVGRTRDRRTSTIREAQRRAAGPRSAAVATPLFKLKDGSD